ncbi:MAG: hypothetical protein M9916_02600 [Crocinitomicaceae bacterium]|nr:hypothetical protein [Crocinitomicaceae bacterium]
MSFSKHIALFVVTLFIVFNSLTQTEVEMKTKADALFNKKEFVEATPLYLRLLSLQPRDYDYSFKYGTCLLFNSTSKQNAIRYLKYAITSPTPIDAAHYYLGKAYHLNYQFNDAIAEYNLYIKSAGIKGEYYNDAKRNIEMCNSGKQLLSTITDIIVRKKTEIKQQDFFRLYDLSDMGGSIITAVDFQSKNDKKYDHKPIVCILPNMENVYFASYGDRDNLDIYVAKRLPGGKYGLPQRLPDVINTPYDEDYPFMHPNGRELYFSSKGHNSMGGYDIFKSQYSDNTYSDVTNVDFAISSPDDDILYVVDKENKNAYFSSTRQSQDGKVVVYKVGVERIPIQLAIIKGGFSSTVLPANSKMTCEVTDKVSGKFIGYFNSLDDDSYLIVFPKGGKYQYTITIAGSNETFKMDIDVPFLKELRPLKQRMEHLIVDGQEQIKITNLFDERFDDAQSIVSQVLKERANLNINEDQFDENELHAQVELQKIISELGMGTKTPNEVSQQLKENYQEASNAKQSDRKLETSTNGVVLAILNQINQTDEQIKNLIKEADNADNLQRKEAILENIAELYEQRDQLFDKIDEIEQISNQLTQANSNGTHVNLREVKTVIDQFSTAIANNQNKEAIATLTENKDLIQSFLKGNNVTSSEKLVQEQLGIQKELTRLKSVEATNIETVKRIEDDIAKLEQQRDAAKPKQKQPIQDEIDAKNYELNDAKSALTKVQTLIAEQAEKRNTNEKHLAVANEIDAYKGKPISNDEIIQAKYNTNNSKIETLRAYSENALAELREKNSTSNESKDYADIAISQYNEQSVEIYSNDEISNYERQKQLLELNTQKQAELKEYLSELKQKENTDATNQQITKIEKLLVELNQDQKILKDSLTSNANKEISKQNIESIISSIAPTYSTLQNQIQEDDQLTEIEKLKQLNSNDHDLIDKLLEEIKQTKEQLAKTSETKVLQAKNQLIDKKINELKTTIAARVKEIEKLAKTDELIAKQQQIQNQIDELGQGADNAYQKAMVTLQESDNAQDNINLLNQLNKDLTKQKQALEAIKVKNPENKSIDPKIVAIENKIDEVAMLVNNEKVELQKQKEIIAQNNQKNANENNTTSTNTQQTTNEVVKPIEQEKKTPTIILEDLQKLYSGDLKTDFTATPSTIEEIATTIQRLENYKQQNNDVLETISNNERADYVAVINQEQQRVNTRIQELEKQKTVLEQAAIAQQTNANQTQENKQPKDTPEQVKPAKTPTVVTKELQASYSGNIESDFNEEPTTVEAINQTVQRLKDYQKQINQVLAKAPKTEKELYKDAVNQETQRISNRIQALEQQKASIEQAIVAQNIENTSSTPSDVVPTTKQQEIEAKMLNDDISKKERKELEKEMLVLKNQQAEKEIDHLIAANETTQQQIETLQQQSQQKNLTNNNTSVYEAEKNDLEAKLLKEKTTAGKELILSQLQDKNEAHLNYLKQVTELEEDQSFVSEHTAARIYDQESLAEKKKRYSIEIGELETLKLEKDYQYATTKNKKEKEQVGVEVGAIKEKQSLLQKEIELIDKQLALYQPIKQPTSLSENTVNLSYNEERQIASTENYEKYATVIAKQDELINKHTVNSENLLKQQQKLTAIRQQEMTASQQERVDLMQQKSNLLDTISNISLSLKQLETEIAQLNKEANTYLPSDSTEAMKYQNLVARGINPIKKSLIAAALVPISVNGIDYNANAHIVSETSMIPVDVLSPKGLVYRVQVGAFAKPLPEGHFKEFTPVTGEKIANTNVIRYMAGFFNNAVSVVDAREKIRQFGYADAFVVAYCDGKRIPFGEARNMEARGECIGQSTNEIQLEVASNIASHLGIEDTTKTLKPVSEFAYNKAPGAAKAEAIEQYDYNQLYFTVQIGVFNKPASNERLHNLKPLYTFRLGNGQIRYNVGLFSSLNSAIDMQTRIRNTAVKEAFVVAYYQNERITIAKALELIRQGVPVYKEGSQETVVKTQVEEDRPDIIEEKTVFNETFTLVKSVVDATSFVQFASKKTFDSYPKDEINRYNVKGNFYYDKNDKRIKSDYYPADTRLPRIATFVDEMDTIHLNREEYLKNYQTKVTISINQRTIPGDFNDWLIKLPYRKEYKLVDETIEVRIFDVQAADMEEIKNTTSLFGFNLSEGKNEEKNGGN